MEKVHQTRRLAVHRNNPFLDGPVSLTVTPRNVAANLRVRSCRVVFFVQLDVASSVVAGDAQVELMPVARAEFDTVLFEKLGHRRVALEVHNDIGPLDLVEVTKSRLDEVLVAFCTVSHWLVPLSRTTASRFL